MRWRCTCRGTIRSAKEDTLSHFSRKIKQRLFSDEIVAMKKLEKFNIPHFNMFDGTGDPVSTFYIFNTGWSLKRMIRGCFIKFFRLV